MNYLNSVECYDPSIDTWRQVASLCEPRTHASVGVLDDIMYAVGGAIGARCCKSVEAYRPSVGVWTPVADMIFEIRHSNYNIYIFKEYIYKNVLNITYF